MACVLSSQGAEKRWWRGYVRGGNPDDAGEFLQKFVEKEQTATSDGKVDAPAAAEGGGGGGGGRRRRGGMVTTTRTPPVQLD